MTITMPSACQAVLFDLDGTLADTAPDLASALNETLRFYGKETLPFDTIRPHVSHGGRALIKLAFGYDSDHSSYAAAREVFLNHYATHIAKQTRLFDGMPSLLDTLEQSAIPWGIVTNKPAYLTDPLVALLGLAPRAGCVVSGDTTAHSKPHPAPLLHACSELGVKPQHCLYIGDAERDIEAGRLAGMTTLVALFGYIGEWDDPRQWGADGLVASPTEIFDWIKAWQQ